MRIAHPNSTVATSLRLGLLAILALGVACAFSAATPRPATHDEFTRALDERRVEVVVVDAFKDDALWATSPFQWRLGPVADNQRPGSSSSGLDVLSLRLDDYGARLRYACDDASILEWLYTYGSWFGGTVVAAWIVTLLAMLLSTPRYGKKWAWFWLFIIGTVGSFLFLLLEPRPLWRRSPESADPLDGAATEPARKLWTGPQGFFAAIAVSWAVYMVAAVVTWAWRTTFS